MTDFNHWDFAGEFTAVQAALLIEGKDPEAAGSDGRSGRYGECVSDVILSRMRSDYTATWSEYAFSDDINGPRQLLPWENKLPSSFMNFMANRCFELGMKAEFEKWLSDGDASNFDRQRFTRKDIQFWLDSNKLPTKYEFEKKTASISDEIPVKEDQTSGRWPWGNHHTDLLGHLDAAARRFWVNYDPSDIGTAPTKVAVSEWLQTERKVSRTMADSIASMLRADGLPTGPRK